MSDSNKSFFSGLHGLITGLAALTTATVAVIGLALNQGWIGGNSKATSITATSAGPSGPQSGTTSVGAATSSGGTALPTFTVNPTAVVFQPVGPRDATVTVRNTGRVAISLETPVLGGVDPSRFSVSTLDCGVSLEPGRSCAIKVTFVPAPGNFTANLVLQVVGAPKTVEVPLKASAIL